MAYSAQWYTEYINTEYWKTLKRAVFEAVGWRCEVCSKQFEKPNPKHRSKFPRGIVCHHLTYEHLGEELLSELSALCADCHIDVHLNEQAPPFMIIIYSRRPPPIVAKILAAA